MVDIEVMKLVLFVAFVGCVCWINVSASDPVGVENFETDEAKYVGLRDDVVVNPLENGAENQLQKENLEVVEKRAVNADQQIAKLSLQVDKLQAAVIEKDVQNAEMMQQIDALIRQNAETLKLVNEMRTNQKATGAGRIATLSKDYNIVTTGGVHYIRWGSNECPDSAMPLYRGYTAGTHYSHTWGGTNTLCLHDRPQWGSTRTGFMGTYIYGAEYGFSSEPFSASNNGGHSLYYHDVPCTLCHSPLRSNQLMIPGRRECPTGWTQEYRGYIVATHVVHNFVKSEYICLDDAPDVRVGGNGQVNGQVLQPVLVGCGSIPCPRYVHGLPLTCVVCTK